MHTFKRRYIPKIIRQVSYIKKVSIQIERKILFHSILSAIKKKTEKRKRGKKFLSSPAGNRTPVSRVTGGDTHHYTTEELLLKNRNFLGSYQNGSRSLTENGFKTL